MAEGFKTKHIELSGLNLQEYLETFPEKIITPAVRTTGRKAARKSQTYTIQTQKKQFWPLPKNSKYLSAKKLRRITPKGTWNKPLNDKTRSEYLFAFYLNWYNKHFGLQKVLAEGPKKVQKQKGIPVSLRPKSLNFPVFGRNKRAVKRGFVIKLKNGKKVVSYRLNKKTYRTPLFHDLDDFFTPARINTIRRRFFREFKIDFDKTVQKRINSQIKRNQRRIASFSGG